MSLRNKLVETFGRGNVITMSRDRALSAGLSPDDAEQLTQVGLPLEVDPFFTTRVVGSPELFASRDFTAHSEARNVVFLGGPPDDNQMRYFLDPREGFVALIGFYEEGPQAEIVNSTVGDFIDFLCELGLRNKELPLATHEEDQKYTERLISYLRERDPFAFRRPDTWWAIAVDRLQADGGNEA